MDRQTVDYGIDLGTTNSCIAIFQGVDPEIIPTNDGADYTPSVVYVDRQERVIVGRAAKERLVSDPSNGHKEFKRSMGRDVSRIFERSQRVYSPEELSAEVLRSLKQDVFQRKGELITEAVVAVPAVFDLSENEATRKAAELAGIQKAHLLQEPIAAALAYLHNDARQRGFWFVYDLGGGTFDAAILHLDDGVFSVIAHGGDDKLGGKDLDELITSEVLQHLSENYDLAGIQEKDPKWDVARAKLRLAVEKAKIQLSRDLSAEILVEYLCDDLQGTRVEVEYELRREDLERLFDPLIARSLNICRDVLEEARLEANAIEELLLVGGPTLTPYLREQLIDPVRGLGMKINHGMNPITVVAEGASIFAHSQRRENLETKPPASGEVNVILEYEPAGPLPNPSVAGRLEFADPVDLTQITIEFVNQESKSPWRSGKVQLDEDGIFTTELHAEPNCLNVYRIIVADQAGHQFPTNPDRLTYSILKVLSNAPLTHSVGVALANDKIYPYMAKGCALPSRKMNPLKISHDITHGSNLTFINIPVVEGENIRASRNRHVGTLTISAEEISRDIPAGTEIEISVSIDSSRIIRASAYLPLLDQWFEAEIILRRTNPDYASVKSDFSAELVRYEELVESAEVHEDSLATRKISRIESEDQLNEIENHLLSSAQDGEALVLAYDRLLTLKDRLDEIEHILKWPEMVSKADEQIEFSRNMVKELGSESDQHEVDRLEAEIRNAILLEDAHLAEQRFADLEDLNYSVLQNDPRFWLGYLDHLKTEMGHHLQSAQALTLFSEADRAIQEYDFPGLRGCVYGLIHLLPNEQRQSILKGYGSSLIA